MNLKLLVLVVSDALVRVVNEFVLVLIIAFVAALLTYLGAPAAERFNVPYQIVSAALQFAGGIISALVAISLMSPAVHNGPLFAVVLAFFLGGTLFVVIEYLTSQRQADPALRQAAGLSGFYIGILADLLIDGAVIGAGSTLSLKTGLLLALGMAISTAPLAFVTIATAKQHGMPRETRQRLAYLFFGCVLGGAILGYVLLRNQPEVVKLTLIALAAGFLITTVTQSIIPEANREGEPSFAGNPVRGWHIHLCLVDLAGRIGTLDRTIYKVLQEIIRRKEKISCSCWIYC